MTQKLREILQSVLLNIKADGLCNLDESCGCGLDDLAPCGNCNLDECEPAKWIKPEDGNPMVLEEFPEGYYSPLKKQAARIQELESSLDEAEALTKQNAELMNGYLRRIAELEDALVEERAGAIRCEFYDHCEIDLPDAMIRARQELQADGKIGPDAAKPQSWQITDERKAAIGRAIESVVAADSDSEEQESEDVYTWRVLRAMLREAE